MRGGSDTRRAEVQPTGLLLRERHELLHRLGRQTLIRHQRVRHRAHASQRVERFDRIERQLLKRRQNRMRRRGEQQRVTVGIGIISPRESSSPFMNLLLYIIFHYLYIL